MTYGSLFSGIGGMDLGLDRAGWECRFQIEIDPFCLRVLAKHWPDVTRYSDIREVRGAEVERVDLLAGGFPCQDVSEAGQRTGIDGARSGLWREFHRLIREIRPRFVLVENVPGLLNRGMGRVLGDLASIGFDAEWEVLGADDMGATQRRKRVWILAYPDDSGLQRPIWAGQPRASSPQGQAAHREPLRSTGGFWPPGPRAVHDIPRMADGPAHKMERLRALGNAVVPQVAQFIGARLLESANA